MLPSLVLIGTRKGGTTALSNLIKYHPSIAMPDCKTNRRSFPPKVRQLMCVWDKEVRFFSRGRTAGASLDWYRSLYKCIVEDEVHRVAFDGSPDYLVRSSSRPAHSSLDWPC
jgi:hypothetical protein